MEYQISIENKSDKRSPLHFRGQADSAAVFIGNVINGKFKLPEVVGKTKNGKDKMKQMPFKPNGEWRICTITAPGRTFDEVVGRII